MDVDETRLIDEQPLIIDTFKSSQSILPVTGVDFLSETTSSLKFVFDKSFDEISQELPIDMTQNHELIVKRYEYLIDRLITNILSTQDELDTSGWLPEINLLNLLNAYRLALERKRDAINRGTTEILELLIARIFDYFIILLCEIGELDTDYQPSTILIVMVENYDACNDFMIDLATVAYRKGRFNDIFVPLLNAVYEGQRIACYHDTINSRWLLLMKQIVDITITVDGVSIRPVCNLIKTLENFLPELCTKTGREISKTSFLAPFISLTVFVDENPNLASSYLRKRSSLDKLLISSLQSDLQHTRTLLFNIFHSLLVNQDSRYKVLKYLATILAANAKRSQLNSDEKALARDGFMLNIMAILQQLSTKIKLSRIDTMYLFHPKCLVVIENDTKLRFDQKEYEEWVQQIQNDATRNVEEVKFPTHCWFLTLHAQHLGIIPAIQHYTKLLRGIKELQRLLDELNTTKPQWENTSLARQHLQFKKRWTQQIKQLKR